MGSESFISASLEIAHAATLSWDIAYEFGVGYMAILRLDIRTIVSWLKVNVTTNGRLLLGVGWIVPKERGRCITKQMLN